MDVLNFDTVVIGAGPAGMHAATLARKAGDRVCVIERDMVGGTCLNRGCIPTKALVQSAHVVDTVRGSSKHGVSIAGVPELHYDVAVDRKDEVVAGLRQSAEASLSNVVLMRGDAVFVDKSTLQVGRSMVTATHRIIVATGSAPLGLQVPGADLAMTSDDFLRHRQLPQELVVIGGGVIGIECACIADAFGCKVTVLEYCKEILPAMDSEMAKRLRMLLGRRGINIVVGAEVRALADNGGNISVNYVDKKGAHVCGAPVVLMATGRGVVLPPGLKEIGVEVGPKGIVVDEVFATTSPSIYAIGDCNGQLMLAHAATAQAEVALGVRGSVADVPAVVFSSPECAQVGTLSSTDAYPEVVTAKSMYAGNGMAAAMGATDGFVKVAIEASTRRIIGCCAIGISANAIVQEAAIAIGGGLTVDELRDRVVFSHPTISELFASALPA